MVKQGDVINHIKKAPLKQVNAKNNGPLNSEKPMNLFQINIISLKIKTSLQL